MSRRDGVVLGSMTMAPTTQAAFDARAERHRRELHVHCYRMLGNFEEAEDAVQETLLRAWRAREDLERDEWLRAWLYKIATNTCLDAIKRAGRRVPALGSFRDVPWLQPYPDALLEQVAAPGAEPDAAIVRRETIELAFLAVIQLLPPRQRAVLILREVLGWSARDVAALLEIGVAAVNSALQRARATLREQLPPGRREEWAARAATDAERELLAGFIDTHERGDVDGALALIADDVRVTMPPQPLVYEGIDAADRADAERVRVGRVRRVAAGADAGEPDARRGELPPRARRRRLPRRSSSTCCASRTAGSPRSRRSTRRCSRPSASRRRSDARYRPRMGRMRRGWQLSKESWAVVKGDRSLLVFPVIAGLGTLILVAAFGGAALACWSRAPPLAIVLGVIGLYLVMVVTVFCSVALTACAARSLEGVDTKASEGWAAARGRFGPILSWAGVQLVVGAAISALQALLREGAGPLVSSLVGSLANFAWTIATLLRHPGHRARGPRPVRRAQALRGDHQAALGRGRDRLVRDRRTRLPVRVPAGRGARRARDRGRGPWPAR